MDVLLQHPEWSSWMNLAGSEYPLHTLSWIENAVSNSIRSGRPNVEILPNVQTLKPPSSTDIATRTQFDRLFPHGLVKGSGFVVISRSAVMRMKPMLALPLLRQLFAREFSQYDPFERLYPTLALTQLGWNVTSMSSVGRRFEWTAKYVQWGGYKRQCFGKPSDSTHPCILTIGDLPYLTPTRVDDDSCGLGSPYTPVCSSQALFANKFDPRLDALVVECLRVASFGIAASLAN